MARVDVIIPVFNTPLPYVVAALNGVREQSFSDWTAWIVDDGSEKAYGSALRATLEATGDRRFKLLYTEHKGAGGSRNVAISKGKAPYLAFVDSDDIWMPHHLARQVATLDADEGIDLVHGSRSIIDAQGRLVEVEEPVAGLNEASAEEGFVRMLESNYVIFSATVMRRPVFEKAGGLDETYPCLADKELWMRVLAGGARFHHDHETVVRYRVHEGNISKKTDLLLATRRRMIEEAGSLLEGNERFRGVDWPALRRRMVRHMYLEAAEAHFDAGRYSSALKAALPFRSGLTRRAIGLILRSLVRSVGALGRPAGPDHPRS